MSVISCGILAVPAIVAPDVHWPAVGRQYRARGDGLVRANTTRATA